MWWKVAGPNVRLLLLRCNIFAEMDISRGLLDLSSYSIDTFKIEGPRRELSLLLLTIFTGLGFAPGFLHRLGRGGDQVVGIRVQYKRNLNIFGTSKNYSNHILPLGMLLLIDPYSLLQPG